MTSKGAEKMQNDTIGVDVSKDHLDAYRLADGAERRFANDKGGHKALVKWLMETPLNRVVFEPTGPHHRAVERAAREDEAHGLRDRLGGDRRGLRRRRVRRRGVVGRLHRGRA